MDAPQFVIYNPLGHDADFLRFREPENWLVVPGDGSSPKKYPGGEVVLEDHFTALKDFLQDQDGYVAGWFCYDFARLNPKYDLSSGVSLDYPMVLLASYGEAELRDRLTNPEGRPRLGTFETSLSRRNYQQRIRNIKRLIRRGYVYQINYSHRFTATVEGSLYDLFARVPMGTLPPQSAYCRFGDFESLSLSPERFFSVRGKNIRTEPIKGTRPRQNTNNRTGSMKRDLVTSEKDSAEHVMIVDLERNDLNRLCEPGSVRVPHLKQPKSFPTVHHLVSTVEGKLKDGVGPIDCFRELFPGGSVTGCPKPIALRIIDQLESRARGLYTGTIGFWDLDREVADWNLAIRTLVRTGAKVTWDSGGGIVIDSDEVEEYRESLDKVELIRSIRSELYPNKSPSQSR